MTVSYEANEIPFVRGAGLRGNCVFSAIRFIALQMPNGRGMCNDSAACHLIDGEHFPLEMQLFAENENERIQISYFFTSQTHKNFCLEPLMNHLESVKSLKSFKSTTTTFCLEQILPKIESGFFVYDKFVANENGECKRMRCIIEANALIPIGSTQLERIQKIQQSLIFRKEGVSDEDNPIFLRQYFRQRRSDRLAHKGIIRVR